jgi:hypothetical protein
MIDNAVSTPEEGLTFTSASRSVISRLPDIKAGKVQEYRAHPQTSRVNPKNRPAESAHLELRDVKIVNDDTSRECILGIELRNKSGVGFCKSMPGAILPFQRVRKAQPKPLKKTSSRRNN